MLYCYNVFMTEYWMVYINVIHLTILESSPITINGRMTIGNIRCPKETSVESVIISFQEKIRNRASNASHMKVSIIFLILNIWLSRFCMGVHVGGETSDFCENCSAHILFIFNLLLTLFILQTSVTCNGCNQKIHSKRSTDMLELDIQMDATFG